MNPNKMVISEHIEKGGRANPSMKSIKMEANYIFQKTGRFRCKLVKSTFGMLEMTFSQREVIGFLKRGNRILLIDKDGSLIMRNY